MNLKIDAWGLLIAAILMAAVLSLSFFIGGALPANQIIILLDIMALSFLSGFGFGYGGGGGFGGCFYI